MPGIVALVLCLGAGAAHGQRVTASVSADSVTVGQRFFLTLLVDHAATERPVFPDEAAAEIDTTTGHVRLGDLEILARAAYATRPLDDRFVRDSLVYEVATFALDTAFVPPVPVHFTADADTLTAASEPFFVPVISLVPADAQDIRDLAPPAEFPRPMWPWALLGAVALILAALAVYYRRTRAPEAPPPVTAAPAPPASPYQEAVERLRRLESLDPATGKPFYVELSETLRTYLSRRLGVSAMEETTSELVYELKRYAERGQVTEAVVDEVHAVLELADFVKFADARPPAPRGREALARARTAVQTVETRWATPPERMTGASEPPEGTPPAGGDALPSRSGASPEPPPKRRFRPAVVAGGVVGAATAFYGGLVNLPPLALAFVYALVVRRLTPPSRRPLADTLAIQAGLYTWLLVGYVLAPELVAEPWLASASMLAVVLGLAWLMIRPGLPSALALGLVHALALAADAPGLLEAAWGSPAHRALAVDVVLRLAALVTMALGVRAVRSNRDAPAAPHTQAFGA
ncbi:hypothetical protein [Rhodocaloribacter sp.]